MSQSGKEHDTLIDQLKEVVATSTPTDAIEKLFSNYLAFNDDALTFEHFLIDILAKGKEVEIYWGIILEMLNRLRLPHLTMSYFNVILRRYKNKIDIIKALVNFAEDWGWDLTNLKLKKVPISNEIIVESVKILVNVDKNKWSLDPIGVIAFYIENTPNLSIQNFISISATIDEKRFKLERKDLDLILPILEKTYVRLGIQNSGTRGNQADEINLLFLSDLHFGIKINPEITEQALNLKKQALDDLIKKLKEISNNLPQWHPNYIIIAGDIGWAGKQEDYTEAKVWLTHLQQEISTSQIIVVPGNHDLDRAQLDLTDIPPKNRTEADQLLLIDKLDKRAVFFKYFTRFCDDLHIQKANLGPSQSNYLTGVIRFSNINFIIINSSWFHFKDHTSRGNLYLGANLIQLLKEDLLEKDNFKDPQKPIVVSIFHHPEIWLNEGEISPQVDTVNTLEYLATRVHLILTGHEHIRNPLPPDKKFNRAFHFSGGATYDNERYWNNCQILKIDCYKKQIQRKIIHWIPTVPKWDVVSDPEIYQI